MGKKLNGMRAPTLWSGFSAISWNYGAMLAKKTVFACHKTKRTLEGK